MTSQIKLPEKHAFVPEKVLPLWRGAADSLQFVRESANVVFRFAPENYRSLCVVDAKFGASPGEILSLAQLFDVAYNRF